VSDNSSSERGTAVLLLTCPDQKGIVATVAEFVYRHGGNIIHAEQHTDAERGIFFQRVEFELDGLNLAPDDIEPAFASIARRYDMQFDLRRSAHRAKLAIFVSRQALCLYDLLARWRTGELRGEVVVVVSNHPDLADVAEHFGVDYRHLPVTPGDKSSQERAAIDVLRAHDVDLVVLARYMQVLSPAFVAAYPHRIINIHHSFLPAFVGASPYRQAHERGVKIIGATAHYATEELDEGPIIDQDVTRVSHRDSVDDLVQKGRDLETIVLARAVRAHLEAPGARLRQQDRRVRLNADARPYGEFAAGCRR